jgi:multisubunit Na+/H+ antiporter MnhG subunit
MSWFTALAVALFAAGIAVVLVSGVAALRFRRVYDRLHFLTPGTTLGAPLVGVALGLENGWSLATAEILFTCFLVLVTGAVMAAATGRMAAQREGLVARESPE